MKKIAVDAMGGDNAPQAMVEGVNQAIRDFDDIEIVLYGDEAKIKDYFNRNRTCIDCTYGRKNRFR